MNRKNFISLVRNYLYDTDSLVWRDDELLEMTEHAVKAYSEDTRFFHSQIDFVPEKDGTYLYPENFICFNVGWNSEGANIRAVSSDEINYYFPDPLSIKGVPDFIFDDISTRGSFRLCPDPSLMQQINENVCDDYGVLYDDNYGTVKDSRQYGVLYSITSYNFAGDMMYSRYAEFEEIGDYLALLYHVLFQAFDVDSDFFDADKADYYKKMYKNRVSMFNQVKYKHCGQSALNKFF